jgi:UDP-hydrolysing UDP-N-acetyl-D-glucosamine 2-epimerase
MEKRKICVVTGSRADYGLLYWLMKGIQREPQLELQLAVTGMHLAPEFGLTYKTIEADGFRISARIEMLVSSDTAPGVAKSVGLGVIGFADAISALQPNVIVLLGDRFEIFAAAQAALFAKVPVAHIAGGDSTEGALDESIRHCITKLSHLHFVTNELSRARVIQMGENPAHVYNVGSPGIDYIKRTDLLDRSALEQSLEFRFRSKNLLITFHPSTLSAVDTAEELQQLLDALKELGEDYGLIFTGPNADSGGRVLYAMIDKFAAAHPNARVYPSLGQRIYLSVMAQADAVVGNSSSGLYEAPSLKKPTVNIGDRQKSRLLAASVVSCAAERGAILAALRRALDLDCSAVVNPYGEGNSSERILAILKEQRDPAQLLQKHFHAPASS